MRRKWFGALVAAIAVSVVSLPASAGTSALGGRIVFTDAFGGSGIYAIGADGEQRVLLVAADDEYLALPRWAPDGSGVAFTASRRFPRVRIDTVDDDGENRTTLVGPGEVPDGWVIDAFDWSPDGARLILALQERDTGRRRLYVTPTDGSTMDLVALNAFSPDWSSTDRIVALRGGADVIVTMDADGANQTMIVDGRRNVAPRWSADGSRIVFERVIKTPGQPARSDVVVVNADGSGITNITDSPGVYDWSPSWSPSGRHIVWSPSPPGESFGFADLWRMRANGGGQTPIALTNRLDEYQADWADLPV